MTKCGWRWRAFRSWLSNAELNVAVLRKNNPIYIDVGSGVSKASADTQQVIVIDE